MQVINIPEKVRRFSWHGYCPSEIFRRSEISEEEFSKMRENITERR